MSRIDPIVVAGALALASIFPLCSAAAQAEVIGTPADWAGSETCAACHEDVANSFAVTAHGRVFARGVRAKLETAGCESCHGPGLAHVEAGGDASKIKNPARLPPSEASEGCRSCHGRDVPQMFWPGSIHEARGVACTSCHSVHRAKADPGLAHTGVVESCLECHKDQRRNLVARSRHPLRERKMDCADCHNPHGSAAPSLLAAASVFDTCTPCHAEMRGPFLWEHPPVRESCLHCHEAHGSNHDKLLVTNNFRLCQSCHIQGRHQTVAGNPQRFFMTNRACMNCHPQVHGSNHPSGPILQR